MIFRQFTNTTTNKKPRWWADLDVLLIKESISTAPSSWSALTQLSVSYTSRDQLILVPQYHWDHSIALICNQRFAYF
jgi:hypothetical protein